MRGFIQNKLVTVSTTKLAAISVGISVVVTAILTSILSFLIMGRLSLELLVANTLIGIIVPLIVAPFVISLLKQATNWEQVSYELKKENIEQKRLEEEAEQKVRDLQAVNELAIECAATLPETDIIQLIAEKLRSITHAIGVGITLYEPARRILTIKHIAVSGQVLTIANQLVGFNLVGMETPVTPEMERHMISGTVESFEDLSDVSFGTVPKPVALLFKSTLGIGNFVALALSYGGKLVGTAIIALRKEQPTVDLDIYKTLAHVAAVSIQRKNAEEALRESENKFRTLIENLSEGILLLDEQGSIIEWNRAQEDIAGLLREQVIGKPIWEVQFQLTPEPQRTPEFYERMKQRARQILTSGESSNFNRPIIGPIQSGNGKVKHVLQTSFPIRSFNHYRIGSIMRDISSQVHAEAERNNLIAELKSKNTELEQFTYTVSHDLKAPIITIRGFLGMLEKDAFGGNMERLRKDIYRITEAAEKMQRLLNELLELSRIGRVIHPPRAIPFEQIVHDGLSSVHGRLAVNKVQVDIKQDLPIVFVDPTRINQVVQNLLDNSAKFMGEQPDPRIAIGTNGADTDGKPIFYVRDNGIGIAPQHVESVFRLFQKLNPYAEGTGIGLVVAKRIIEVHGGRIWVESEGLGKGTTVYFTLPVP
ncbi:MAG: ATP-binding protein [Anaerolineales bacterium]